MILVDHRTNNPLADMYGYALGTVPNDRTAAFPKGVTIDGKIMPQRDIDDAANGTDTWKQLHGVDLYFIEEGAWERVLACNQFGGLGPNLRRNINGTFPNTWKSQYIQDEGYIPSYAWRQAQGDHPGSAISPGRSYSGLAQCFDRWFLAISSDTQLPNSVMQWPNGADLESTIPAGYPFAGKTTRDFPDLLLGKLQVSDMTSKIDDWYSGAPLSAESVRAAYRDMEKLHYYVLSANDWPGGQTPPNGYQAVLSTYTGGYDLIDGGGSVPSFGYTGNVIVQQESMVAFWAIWEIYDADFYLPFCGKYGGDPGSYNPMYGQEVAMYAWLRLYRRNPDGTEYTKYGLFQVPYTIYRRDGVTFVLASDLVQPAYDLINRYNAEIAHSTAADYAHRETTIVRLDRLFAVCKASDRTDTTQLNWNRR